MNEALPVFTIQCPYCWELIELIIDDCGESQQYIEDCSVCCRPMRIEVVEDGYRLTVQAFRDDE